MLGLIFKSKISKKYLLILQMVFFIPVFGTTQAPEPKPAQEDTFSMDEIKDLFSGAKNEEKLEMALKKVNFEKLPKYLQEAYELTNQKYISFLRKIDIKNGLKDLCDAIKKKLDLLAEKKQNPETSEKVKNLKDALTKFEEALFGNAFKQIPIIPKEMQIDVLANMKAMLAKAFGVTEKTDSKEELEELAERKLKIEENKKPAAPKVYEEKDFDELFDLFAKVFSEIKESGDVEFLSNVLSFRNIVIKILPTETKTADQQTTDYSKYDPSELVKRYLNYIDPLQKEATGALRALRKLFRHVSAPIRQASRTESVRAFNAGEDAPAVDKQLELYDYWIEDIEKSLETLNAFNDLQSSAYSTLGQGLWLFDKAGYIYDLAQPILSLYLKDKVESGSLNWGHQFFIEKSIDALLAYWIVQIQDCRQAKQDLFPKILREDPLVHKASPLDMLAQLSSALQPGRGIDPTEMVQKMVFSIMNKSTNPFEKRLLKNGLFAIKFWGALNYVWHGHKGVSAQIYQYFENYPELARMTVKLKDLFTEVAFEYGKIAIFQRQFAPQFSHVQKNRLLTIGHDAVSFSCDMIEKGMNSTMPSFLANCDKFSFGTINPELFKGMSQTILNIFVHSKGWMDGDGFDFKTWIDAANSNKKETRDATLGNLEQAIKDLDSSDEHTRTEAQKKLKQIPKLASRDTLVRYQRLKDNGSKFAFSDKVGSLQSYLVESYLVSYILACFGTKLAEVAVKHFEKPLFGATFKVFDYTADKIASLGQKLGIIDESDSEDLRSLKTGIESTFDQVPQMIQQLLAMLSGKAQAPDIKNFAGQIPLMLLMMTFQSYINTYAPIQKTDTQDIRDKKVLAGFLHALISDFGLMQYTDGYALTKKFNTKKELENTLISVIEPEISEEFVVDFINKSSQFNPELAKQTTEDLKEKKASPRQILIEILQNLEEINIEKSAMDELVKMALPVLIPEIKKEFLDSFVCKLAQFNTELAKDLTAMLQDKQAPTRKVLITIFRRLDVEFAKEFADRLKRGIFTSILGKKIFVPLLHYTIGNWLRDKGTVLDGVDWVQQKFTDLTTSKAPVH